MFLHFTLNIIKVKTVRDVYDIQTVSWSNIVKSTKQMKIPDILLKNVLYLEKYLKYRKFEGRFFYRQSTKHLTKRKNEIGLTVYELKTGIWKNSIPSQNEITTSKPWNHDANGRSQYL